MAEDYKIIAARKQAERDSKIPAAWRLATLPSPEVLNVLDVPQKCGLLTPRELEITERYDATPLAAVVAARQYSCVEVVTAFCKRAAIAQQVTNCLTQVYFDSALERATALDKHLADPHAKPMGPFHGVPVSLKDVFNVAGSDSSLAMADFCGKPSQHTSLVVQILQNAGAVIICKTNIPQGLNGDPNNNIWGLTLNPYDRRLTAGGSSGGEGALLAMRGSALGLGTDLGGSIRLPAACQHIYSMKPSEKRIPVGDTTTHRVPGWDSVAAWGPTIGPMAHSVRDCELLMRVVTNASPWDLDPTIVPGPYDATDLSPPGPRPLTFGLLRTDGIVNALPPTMRVLDEVAATLTAAGHRIIPITPPPALKDFMSTMWSIFSINGTDDFFARLAKHNEPLTPFLAATSRPTSDKTVAEARVAHTQRLAIRTALLSLFKPIDPTTNQPIAVDAILTHATKFPNPEIHKWAGNVSYMSEANLLDIPAGTVPVDFVTADDLEVEMSEGEVPFATELDGKMRGLWGNRERRQVYLGSPLSVQLYALRLQEKRLIRAMGVVDEVVKDMNSRKGQ